MLVEHALRQKYRITQQEISAAMGISRMRFVDIICGVALVGINDDSLSQFLSAWLRWRRKRAVIFYRGK